MREHNSTTRSFIIGIAAGGAAGAIAGLLLAPKSGKELMHDIAVQKDKMIYNANKKIKKTQREVSEILTKGRNRTEALLEDSKMKLVYLRKRTGNIINSGKETITGKTIHLKDALMSGIDAYKEERKKVHH